MNYCKQFLQTMILMLISSHVGFSMEERPPRKSILNPEAPAFLPLLTSPEYHHQTQQQQTNQNPPPQFQQPLHKSPGQSSSEFHPQFITNTVNKYHPPPHFPNISEFHSHSSNPQTSREDLDENEAFSLLPDFMRDEYGTKKDIIFENVDQGKQIGSQGTHLKPMEMREGIGRSEITPKLAAEENALQIEKNKINPIHRQVNPSLKFGSINIPENLLTSQKDESKKLVDQKHHQNIEESNENSSSLDKVDITLGHKIIGIEGEKVEKSERIHGEKKTEKIHSFSDTDSSNSEKKFEKGHEQQKMEMKVKHFDHADKEKLKKEKFRAVQKDMTSAQSANLDKTFKETLVIGKEAKSPPLYYDKRKKSSIHGGKSSPQSNSGTISPSHSSTKHKKQSPKVEKRPDSLTGNLKEIPEIVSTPIKLTTGKYDLLASENPLGTDPLKQTESSVDKERGDEQIEQSESENIKKQGSRNRQSTKSKGKSVALSKRSQKEKEKEEAELLRKEIKKAAKERWEQEQLKKATLDFMNASNKKKMEELGHSGNLLPTDSTIITNLVHGEGSGSSSSGNTKRRRPKVRPVPASYKIPDESNKSSAAIETELLLHKKSQEEGQEKWKQINDILEKLQEKINEIEKSEKELKKQEQILIIEKLSKFDGKFKWNEKIDKQLEKFAELVKQAQKEDEKIMNLQKKLIELQENAKNWSKQKLEKKLNIEGAKISQLSEISKKLQTELDELSKLFKMELIELLGPNEQWETKEMKAIQEKMEKPLKYLWTAYNLVLKILNKHWEKSNVKNQFALKRPYHFISSITMTMHGSDIIKFNKTMKLTLEKMLMHRNIYRAMNMISNGVLVHERLNCFDELSEKINWLAEERKKNEIEENHAERMETFGKFFKKELNKYFHDVFHFNLVGLDELPDVWEQMVMEGIGRLSEWLPKDRQRQFNEIWLQLYEYYEEEKLNLEWLTSEDEVAEAIFDLLPDVEYIDKRLKNQLEKIDELHNLMDESVKFSNDVKNYMLDVFDKITDFIRCINILLKIEKRKEHPLLYLKSVYDKYWYFIVEKRFHTNFLSIRQYHFYREENQTKRAKDLIEEIVEMNTDIREEIKPIFDKIEHIEPSILDEIMTIIDVIDEVVAKNEIIERGIRYENDQDFMNSVLKESPFKVEYDIRKTMVTSAKGDEEEKKE